MLLRSCPDWLLSHHGLFVQGALHSRATRRGSPLYWWMYCLRQSSVSCDGREVKALDSKSNGVSPRRFEPCSQRISGLLEILILPLRHKMGISMMYYIQRKMKRLFHSCVSATTLLHRNQSGLKYSGTVPDFRRAVFGCGKKSYIKNK